MEKQEYAKMINSIIIPENLPLEERYKRFQPIRDFLNSEIPKELYRFRSCNERHISAFDRDELSFSPGYKMNDDFDGLLFFDKEYIKTEFKAAVESKLIRNALYNIGQGVSFPAALQNAVPPQMLSAMYAYIANLDPKTIDDRIDNLYNSTMSHFDEELLSISRLIQNSKIASFSGAIDSAAMWGYYADEGKGFALSYDFRNGNYSTCNLCATNQQCQMANNCFLLPIIYSDDRYDATKFAIWIFQQRIIEKILINANAYNLIKNFIHAVPCPDEFVSTKALIHKAMVWDHEEEWRMIFTCKSPEINQQEYPYAKKRPSAVYLGRNISEINEKILKYIAGVKGIPVYKMMIRENDPTYKLHPELVK